MTLKTKRIYEQTESSDGERVLVDGIWPRGVSKEDAQLSEWKKELAPSKELRQWFSHDPDKWDEFLKSYREELEGSGAISELDELARRSRSNTVTLLYAARDADHNNARALAILAERRNG